MKPAFVSSLVSTVALAVVLSQPSAGAQAIPGASCDDLLPKARGVAGSPVGPQSCLMQEVDFAIEGRAFKRLELGLDGAVDGFMVKEGEYKEYLVDGPDLVFPQTGASGPFYRAVANYERNKGAAMTIVYPGEPGAWNGKMWVTAHGAGLSFAQGNLRPWDKNLDPADPQRGLSRYDLLMLGKGYALVKTRRSATQAKVNTTSEITATLEDGSRMENVSFNESHRYIIDFTLVAKTLIERRMKQVPRRTYLYGHSSGARMGRAINYTPELNKDRDGKAIFDGFLVDDSGAGVWLPVVFKEGKDVLFATEAAKAAVVPQLEVVHQMYNNIWIPERPAWVSASFLENKRINAKLLRDKGLTSKFRAYEVRSFSHSTGGGGLELAALMDRFIDLLDDWVDRGVAPPPTRSDWAELGDPNRKGAIEYPALALPEVACPLGVYYPTTMTAGSIAFAPFTGSGLEPLDRNGVFVDMNRNGVWDFRETPSAAWTRLGLLTPGKALTRENFVACIQAAAERLRNDGFFSAATAAAAIERAKKAGLQPTEIRATELPR